MKNSEILQATNIDSIKSNEPKLLNLRDLQRVLTGRFDASILKPKKADLFCLFFIHLYH